MNSMSFRVVVDSGCDMTPQMMNDPCYKKVPLTVYANGSTFIDDETFDQADLLWAMKQSDKAPTHPARPLRLIWMHTEG